MKLQEPRQLVPRGRMLLPLPRQRAVITVCPKGTIENSPRFQPWVQHGNQISPEGTAETPISRSAGFPVCRIADILVGGASESSRRLESFGIRRLKSLRNGRPRGLRHVPQFRSEGTADNGRPFLAATATAPSKLSKLPALFSLSSGERAGVRAVVSFRHQPPI